MSVFHQVTIHDCSCSGSAIVLAVGAVAIEEEEEEEHGVVREWSGTRR